MLARKKFKDSVIELTLHEENPGQEDKSGKYRVVGR